MSESPTHPDAPRAGGETPDLLPCPFCGETRVRAYCTGGWWCIRCTQRKCQAHAYPFAETEADAVAAWNRRASLLERHRDGERLDWLERAVPSGEFRDFCNALHNQWPGSVRQLIDAAMSAPPSPERASK